MIATAVCSRLGIRKTSFLRRHRHDQPAASRGRSGLWKFPYVVLLILAFVSYLVLQIQVISNNFVTPSSERERFTYQHLNLPGNFSLSNEASNTKSNWNRVLYTGSFGFGHRMSKLSAAVHLIVSSEFRRYIPLVEVQWGTCRSDDASSDASGVDIFAYLFNSTYLFLSSIRSITSSDDNGLDPFHSSGGKVLWIRNDVAGYYAGQAYKNARLSLNYSQAFVVFQDKLRMDYSLYEHLFLSKRFIGFDEAQKFQKQHHWNEFFVMGVHIRAGNGEQNHFTSAQRNGFSHQSGIEVIYSIARSIQHLYRASMEQQSPAGQIKAPLVFLATDTEYYIQALRVELSDFCDVIIYHQQPRVPPGQGVSYETNWTNSDPHTCLKGWYGAAMDMKILSSSDVIIATSRSTFTQIVPASIVFHRVTDHKWRYCEMDLFTSPIATKMTCFHDQTSWLHRRNEVDLLTFCIPKRGETNSAVCRESSTISPVAQKVMIHFPDVSQSRDHDRMYQSTIAFLKSSNPLLPNETLFYYGKKYNPRYRHSVKNEKGLAYWTWQ